MYNRKKDPLASGANSPVSSLIPLTCTLSLEHYYSLSSREDTEMSEPGRK